MGIEVGLDQIKLEHPADAKFGDYSANIAMPLFVKVKNQKSPNDFLQKSTGQAKVKVTRPQRLSVAMAGAATPNQSEHGSGQESKIKLSDIKSPLDLAKLIKEEISKIINLKSSIINRIEAVSPGFINFTLLEDYLIRQAEELLSIDKFRQRMAKSGKGKTMVIDYSAPNIAKPFGIGHLRSTTIGQAIYNLYQALGWKTIGDNHLGDWGTQFGKLIYQIELKAKSLKLPPAPRLRRAGKAKTGELEFLQSLTIADLEKLYVEFHKEAEKNPQLEEEARKRFKKLEQGDKEAKEIWQKCVELSLKEFNRVYRLLGVKIDYRYGESFYHFNGWMEKVLSDVKKKGLLKKSRGALVIELPGEEMPAMLVKSDGATLYLLRDLATIKFRMKTWNPDLIVYEVGADHKLHFKQVFKTAVMLDYLEAKKLVHLAHGMIRWKRGKFSTRKGDTIHLEEILKDAVKRAGKLVDQSRTGKGLTKTEKEKIARAVGIGGVKFNDLKQEPERDIIFDWERILSMDGYSGPYLQYTYARAQSVLYKSEITKSQIPKSKSQINFKNQISNDLNQEELSLLRTFYRFGEAVTVSAEQFSPHILCRYLFDLSQKFNLFYQKHRILSLKSEAEGQKQEGGTEQFRLALTQATANILRMGLGILGIETLEKM